MQIGKSMEWFGVKLPVVKVKDLLIEECELDPSLALWYSNDDAEVSQNDCFNGIKIEIHDKGLPFNSIATNLLFTQDWDDNQTVLIGFPISQFLHLYHPSNESNESDREQIFQEVVSTAQSEYHNQVRKLKVDISYVSLPNVLEKIILDYLTDSMLYGLLSKLNPDLDVVGLHYIGPSILE